MLPNDELQARGVGFAEPPHWASLPTQPKCRNTTRADRPCRLQWVLGGEVFGNTTAPGTDKQSTGSRASSTQVSIIYGLVLCDFRVYVVRSRMSYKII